MTVYEVLPHIGVGPVKLGMTREKVRGVMPGRCDAFLKVLNARHETDAFHDRGFQVFYSGEPPVVEYIELSRESCFRVTYRGVEIFEALVEDVLAHVSVDAPFDRTDPELGCSYIFPELDLSLWRPVVPASPEDQEGRKFSTIGVGAVGYYGERH
jgi:hypothetical protein